ncbi:MAG: hypothetical protein PHP06_08790 [Clostridia bacterium]|nr:hypothetical protein [Clostridia bacterium]
MFDDDFKKMTVHCFQEALQAEDLETSFKNISNIITSFYSGTKLWFAKSFGKRWSYFAGSGQDSLIQWEKIEYQKGYAVFLQNFISVPKEEKDVLIDLFKIITTIQK